MRQCLVPREASQMHGMRLIDEVNYWRDCAEEARTVAETFYDPVAREAMLSIAAGYENTANKLEAMHRLS
jgi:hypothetical protein